MRQALAIGFGVLGIVAGNVLLILIALFVYFAASSESRAVQLHHAAERLRVSDATVTELLPLSATDTLDEAARLLLQRISASSRLPMISGGFSVF